MRLPVPFRARPAKSDGTHAGATPPRAPTAPVAIARRRRTSELNDPTWRLALSAVAFTVIAFVVRTVLRPTTSFGVVATSVPALLAWLAVTRLLLLDARRRRIWRIVLLVTGLAVIPGLGGRWLAVAGGIVFLVARGGRVFRHLTPVRRAKLFFLGLLAAALAMVGYARLEQPSWPVHLAQNVVRSAIDLLRLFWCFSVLALFFGMRLHFLRLKPKLAISALFLAIVPVLLLLTLGTATLYGVVGGTLAARGRTTFEHWLGLFDRDPQLGGVLFGPGFHYRLDQPGRAAVAAGDTLPGYLPSLARRLAEREAAEGDSSASLPDTTALVEAGGGLWALRMRGVGTDSVEIWGHAIDSAVLDRLADVLRLDVGIVGGDNVSVRGQQGGLVISMGEEPAKRPQQPEQPEQRGQPEQPGQPAEAPNVVVPTDSSVAHDPNDLEHGSVRVSGHMRTPGTAPDSSRALWDRDLYFGASTLDVLELKGRRLRHDDALLTAKTSLRRLAGEFTSADNEFNRAVLALLAVIASVFLVLEGFALFFGIRITSTITSATQALYAGTMRLARGDLQTQIDIPNEDEFGDLADSFNEMTAAVRQGREQAVARELLEREIGTARQIQERLLPSAMPQLPGFEVVAHSEPSRQVSGDYFDFLPLADGRLGLVIADVSGKGIPAAMLMANLQACLQAQAMHPESVAQILGRVNNQLARSTDASMFATLFLGALDPATGDLTGSCAGHDPAILCRADGTVDRLRAGGLILGMLPDMRYEQETMRLAPGDVLVLFTDGITEAMGPPLQPVVPEGRVVPAPGGAAVAADPSASTARSVPAAGTALVPAAGRAAMGGEPSPVDDDIDEAPDITTNFFDERRLLDVVRAQRHRSAAQIRDAILRAVAQHTAGIPQSDDITLIVVKAMGKAL